MIRFFSYNIICKGIVELHEGTLSVSSDGIGTGCTFRIELPAVLWRGTSSEESEYACVLDEHQRHQSVEGILQPNGVSDVKPGGKKTFSLNFTHGIRSLLFANSPKVRPNDRQQICHSAGNVLNEENEKIRNSSQCRKKKDTKRMLIVDDVPMNRKMLKKVLENRSDVIDEAENGQMAVDMVKATVGGDRDNYYDIITMDYQMPVMDGVTATKHIRDLGYSGGDGQRVG